MHKRIPVTTFLTPQFFTGFFETGGGFIIIFKKDARSHGGYRVQPQIKFTQKNPLRSLSLLQIAALCRERNITARLHHPERERLAGVRPKTTPYFGL